MRLVVQKMNDWKSAQENPSKLPTTSDTSLNQLWLIDNEHVLLWVFIPKLVEMVFVLCL